MATPPDFTAGSVLTTAQMNAVGLWLVKTQTYTAATTWDVKQCFTSDYDWYKITLVFTTASGTLLCQLIDGTTPTVRNAASYYTAGFDYSVVAGAITGVRDVGTTSASISSANITENAAYTMELRYNPSGQTMWSTIGTGVGNAVTQHRSGGYHATATHDGIRFSSSANMAGTVRVYGYRK